MGKGYRWWLWYKYCVATYVNGKITVETLPGIGGGEDKEWGQEQIQLCYIWYIITTFISATMYPYPAQQKRKKNKNMRKISE
jgi:hypothetical protein